MASVRGKLTFLQVQKMGLGFGPPSDFIDVDVVVQVGGNERASYGFKLRNNANRATQQGMLDLLRDAFNHDHTVVIELEELEGQPQQLNRGILRVALDTDSRPPLGLPTR